MSLEMKWWRSLSWTRLPRSLFEAEAAEADTTLSLPSNNSQYKLWLILVIPLSILVIVHIGRFLYLSPFALVRADQEGTRNVLLHKLHCSNSPFCQRAEVANQSIFYRLRARLHNVSQRHFSPPTSAQLSQGYLLHTMDQITYAGLGNFLFVVASLIGVARSTYRHPGLFQGVETQRQALFPHLNFSSIPRDPKLTDEVLNKFTFHSGVAGIYNLDIYKQITHSHDGNATSVDFAILTGFMQSWRYFEAFHDEVRQRLQFIPSIYEQAIQALLVHTPTEILQNSTKNNKGYTLVGIHVRRGDMVNNGYGYQVATESYLLARVSYFTRNYANVLFVVVSNDMAYCQKLFQGMFVFISTVNPPEVDMALLTLMDHLILSMGTFGWWSAYLSDAKEIWFYKSWYKSGSGVEKEYVPRDYFLPTWNISDYKKK